MLPRRVSPAPCGGAGGSDHRRRSKFAPMAAWSRSPPYRSGPALPCPNFAKPMALHEPLGIRRLIGRSTSPAETMRSKMLNRKPIRATDRSETAGATRSPSTVRSLWKTRLYQAFLSAKCRETAVCRPKPPPRPAFKEQMRHSAALASLFAHAAARGKISRRGIGAVGQIELSPAGAGRVVAWRSDASPSSCGERGGNGVLQLRRHSSICPASTGAVLTNSGAHCGSDRSSLTMPQMAQGSIDWPKSTPTQ